MNTRTFVVHHAETTSITLPEHEWRYFHEMFKTNIKYELNIQTRFRIRYDPGSGITKGIYGNNAFSEFSEFVLSKLEQEKIDIYLDVQQCELETDPHVVAAFLGGRELGRGTFGCVTLKSVDGKEFAVKTAVVGEKFQNEVHMLNKCNSNNIVRLHFAAVMNNIGYIVMEYMDKGTLKDYSKNFPLPTLVLRYVAFSVFRGLSHVWSLNCMHRDIKPDNVLLNRGGEVKISDFGESRELDNTERIATTEAGTEAYMAPECSAVDNDYDSRADVYSYGVLLYVLAVPDGLVHVNERSLDERLSEQLVVANDVRLPPDIRKVINGCLALQPTSRWLAERLRLFWTSFSPMPVVLVKWFKTLEGHSKQQRRAERRNQKERLRNGAVFESTPTNSNVNLD